MTFDLQVQSIVLSMICFKMKRCHRRTKNLSVVKVVLNTYNKSFIFRPCEGLEMGHVKFLCCIAVDFGPCDYDVILTIASLKHLKFLVFDCYIKFKVYMHGSFGAALHYRLDLELDKIWSFTQISVELKFCSWFVW